MFIISKFRPVLILFGLIALVSSFTQPKAEESKKIGTICTDLAKIRTIRDFDEVEYKVWRNFCKSMTATDYEIK